MTAIASRNIDKLLVKQPIKANNKENTQDPHCWPLVKWIRCPMDSPSQRTSDAEKISILLYQTISLFATITIDSKLNIIPMVNQWTQVYILYIRTVIQSEKNAQHDKMVCEIYISILQVSCTATWREAPTKIARFMGPTWGPSGADRTHMGPMLTPWTLLFG